MRLGSSSQSVMSLSTSLMLHPDKDLLWGADRHWGGTVGLHCFLLCFGILVYIYWTLPPFKQHFCCRLKVGRTLGVCAAEEWKEQVLMTLDVKQMFVKNLCNTLLLNEILAYETDRNVPFWGLFSSFHPLLCSIFNCNWNSNERYFCPLKIMQILTFHFHWNQELVVCLLLQLLVWIHWCSL